MERAQEEWGAILKCLSESLSTREEQESIIFMLLDIIKNLFADITKVLKQLVLECGFALKLSNWL
jgi:hypothetical protein